MHAQVPATNGRRADAIYIVCAFAVFLASVFVRLSGIEHGAPFMVHADEPNFVRRALGILTTGDMNPHWFGHPGTLTIYSLSALYGVHAWLRDEPLSALMQAYQSDPAPFHILGKQWIVVWSMLSQLALWFLARCFVPRWSALLAVALLAVTPLDVTISLLIRTDTQQACLMLVTCLFLIRAVRTGEWRAFAGAGFTLGLAVAVKWPSVVLCLSIVLASFLAPPKRKVWPPSRRQVGQVALAAGASLGAMLLVAPYVFLDFGTVLANVAHEARSEHLGATSPGVGSALAFYLGILASSASVPGFILALVGVVTQFRTPSWRPHLVITSAFVVYLLFISLQNLRWDRWAVPMLPFFFLFVAMGVAKSFDVLRARFAQKPIALRAAALATAGAVVIFGCHEVARVSKMRHSREAGPTATHWITANVPRRSKILTEKYAPYLLSGMYRVYVTDKSGKARRAAQLATYYAPTGSLMDLKDVDAALAKADYVITGSYYGRLRKEKKRYAHEVAVYEEIFRRSELVKRIGTYQIRKVKERRH